MKMHILSGGRLRMKRHVYVPGAPREAMLELPVSCFLFRHGQANVLFDTGCHPAIAENAGERWGGLVRAIVPAMGRDDNVIRELERVNLTPDDIDIVVNSHLHCDHCGCNEFFTKATFYVHEDELAVVRDPDSEGKGYFRAEWDHPMPMVEIAGETDLFDDGRLVLLPLPGHTPGLTGLLAGLPQSGEYLLTSDAVAIRENLDPDVMPKNLWSPDRQTDSLVEIERIAKSGATVVLGHDLAQWSTFKPPEESYD